MKVKFKKDWPSVSGPSFSKDLGKHFAKGWEGDLSTANARTAIKAGYANAVKENKTVKVGSEKAETATKEPKTEKR